MRTVVEVGDWEHECCGPAYERNTVIEISCLVVDDPDGGNAVRYIESHHDVPTRLETVTVRGRVADIRIEHPDGSTEPIDRLPSGDALRGFDDSDDGHLEQPWPGEPVINDSGQYLVTIAS